MTAGYDDTSSYFVERLAEGIARIAASQYPKPVIVRMSDFKTNEYAALIGGMLFEPKEENPMIGWRGASRYYSPDYRDGFALECRAIARVRGRMGLGNVIVMIPFFSTEIYTGPVARALGKADIAMLVGLPVAAGVYLLACRSIDLEHDRQRAAAADVGLDPDDRVGAPVH
jgi:pyruvate,water dikinase